MSRQGPGRPPKAEEHKKSAHLSIRIPAKLRDMLVTAALEEGRPMSEEVALRLSETFYAQQKINERFGGARTALLLQILAERIMATEIEAGGLRWLDDPWVFNQVRKMIDIVLDSRRPRGRRALPKIMRRRLPSLLRDVENMGRHQALRALRLLEAADKEPVPVDMPPVTYIRAAARLKGVHSGRTRKHQRPSEGDDK